MLMLPRAALLGEAVARLKSRLHCAGACGSRNSAHRDISPQSPPATGAFPVDGVAMSVREGHAVGAREQATGADCGLLAGSALYDCAGVVARN
jgi:hypothetical protein